MATAGVQKQCGASAPITLHTLCSSVQTGRAEKHKLCKSMKHNMAISERGVKRPTDAGDQLVTPAEIFYVVQTTGKGIGKRHHRVRSLLYETRRQAQGELLQLRAASAGADTYDVWKSTTYIEPAEWMSDVVMNDGTMIRSTGRGARPGAFTVNTP